MDLLKMGRELLGKKTGDNGELGGIMDALSGLTSGQGLDMGAIADKLKSGGLADQVKSWLGDGGNASVSADEMTNALGPDKMNEMASKLGVDSKTAAEKLSQTVPSLMDKMSSGGSFKDGMASGASPMDIAKNLFK